jgi:DNA-binding NarL/FixJ family response regulator
MAPRMDLLVVAQQPLFAVGLQAVLAHGGHGLRCVSAHTAEEALSRVRTSDRLALVIADLRVGDADGLALLQQVRLCRPHMPRVLMSDEPDPGLAREAQRAGINACLSKTMHADQWVMAIGAVLKGQSDFPAAVDTRAALSERQVSVLQWAAAGLGNRQIAAKLHLTERTVKYHMSESFQRLATATRTEAVARAAALGLITLPGY